MSSITLESIRRLPGDEPKSRRPDPNVRVEAILRGMETVQTMAHEARAVETALRSFAQDHDKNLDTIERLRKENAQHKIKADKWDALVALYPILGTLLPVPKYPNEGSRQTVVTLDIKTQTGVYQESDSFRMEDGDYYQPAGWFTPDDHDKIEKVVGIKP